ncbi:hypothetical protein CFC21_087905 [Triticum aestivum]|uniref:Uncharacterized protein n=2 Tax=Triticum aestivum TaxID=4565 RepID=A0A3B6PKP3_WHEAT|nr:hypothetical protein CFC21_087905 [Triticum aestivum]
MHATVTLSDIPLQYEPVITVGAMAIIRTTYVCSDTPIDESSLGSLEMHQGGVLTPNCSALTLDYKPLKGSDKYFEVKCLAQDSIIEMEYIDLKKHTAYRIESAPVFDMTGKVVGLIYSAGTDVDVKNGFLSKYIISSLRSICKNTDWEAGLKRMGDLKYSNMFGNEE